MKNNSRALFLTDKKAGEGEHYNCRKVKIVEQEKEKS